MEAPVGASRTSSPSRGLAAASVIGENRAAAIACVMARLSNMSFVILQPSSVNRQIRVA